MMTIGRLSRRTGVPVKTLRKYEDLGLIYTTGRSEGNYRLFGEEALWCVGVVGTLRGMGLTLAEICALGRAHLRPDGPPTGPLVADRLRAARARTLARIAELHQVLQRIDRFEADFTAELAGQADFRAFDPLRGRPPLDPPSGGRL